MLKIDPAIFSRNLLLTQRFCNQLISYTVADELLFDNASVFRSFNPEINEKEIFEFGMETFDERLYKIIGWTNDPLQNDWYIDCLYEDQLAYKNNCIVEMPRDLLYQGDIIISKVDETVVDGASAASSYYLFDEYDMPPIDTWFYLAKTPKSRLLFAWIPQDYINYANEAILVNCVDCIGWFKEWYPDEYRMFYLSNYGS